MKQNKRLKMVLRITILPLLLSALVVLNGCSTIRLYPIEKQDIVVMKKGVSYSPDRDGFFLSDMYVKEVMEVKVEQQKLK